MTTNDTNRTTIAHILIERLRETGTNIEFPENLEGDLIKEHNWAIFSEDGPKIMKNHRDLFYHICNEVDYAVSEGVAYFDDEDGSVYIQGKYL